MRNVPPGATAAELGEWFDRWYGEVLFVELPRELGAALHAAREQEVAMGHMGLHRTMWRKPAGSAAAVAAGFAADSGSLQARLLPQGGSENVADGGALSDVPGLAHVGRFAVAPEVQGQTRLCHQSPEKWMPKAEGARHALLGPPKGDSGGNGRVAFVTFRYQFAADAAELDFGVGTVWGQLFGRRTCMSQLARDSLPLFREAEAPFVISRAPDPTNVTWENLQIRASTRAWREVGSMLLVTCLVFASALLSAALHSPSSVLKPATDAPGNFVQFLARHGLHVPASIAQWPVAFVVVLVNYCIAMAFQLLSTLEGHHHITGRCEWLYFKTALADIANVLVVNWYIYGLPSPGDTMWFQNVGSILKTLLVMYIVRGVVRPALTMGCAAAFKRIARKDPASTDSAADAEDRAAHAAEDDETHTAHAVVAFGLSQKYADITTVLFVAVGFAAVEPLLLILAAVYAAGKYTVDKAHLTSLTTPPPMFDERMTKFLERLAPFALLLHGCVAFLAWPGHWHGFAVAEVAIVVFLLFFFEVWESCAEEEVPEDINMGLPFETFWTQPPFVHPLTHRYGMESASDRWVSSVMADMLGQGHVHGHHLDLQSLMADMHLTHAAEEALDSEAAWEENQGTGRYDRRQEVGDGESGVAVHGATATPSAEGVPHTAFGRVPGATLASRMHSWHAMHHVVTHSPRLLGRRMFIIKLYQKPAPVGVVSLDFGNTYQALYLPCRACMVSTNTVLLRDVREAIIASGVLDCERVRKYWNFFGGSASSFYLRSSGGRPTPENFNFVVDREGKNMEATDITAFLLCQREESMRAISFLPEVQVAWAGLKYNNGTSEAPLMFVTQGAEELTMTGSDRAWVECRDVMRRRRRPGAWQAGSIPRRPGRRTGGAMLRRPAFGSVSTGHAWVPTQAWRLLRVEQELPMLGRRKAMRIPRQPEDVTFQDDPYDRRRVRERPPPLPRQPRPSPSPAPVPRPDPPPSTRRRVRERPRPAPTPTPAPAPAPAPRRVRPARAPVRLMAE